MLQSTVERESKGHVEKDVSSPQGIHGVTGQFGESHPKEDEYAETPQNLQKISEIVRH